MTAKKLTTKKYFDDAYKALAKDLKGINVFELPKIEKVSVNVGTGKFDKSDIKKIGDYIEALTGQSPQLFASRMAINGFNLKKGQITGVSATLRGEKAEDFLFNFVHISLPRTKDFQGLNPGAFDTKKISYSAGIPTAGIFPQIGFSALPLFGLQVNIVFKKGGENNKIFLDKLGFPFKK